MKLIKKDTHPLETIEFTCCYTHNWCAETKTITADKNHDIF